jgi:hypothetical protein
MADGLMDSNFISWGGWEHGKARDLALTAREGAERLLEWAPDAQRLIPDVFQLPRITFESTQATGNELAFTFPSTLYASTSFSLVSESDINPEVTRLSEKTVKALCGGHFPMIWGTASSRHLIQKYGFDTVDDGLVWAYDDEDEPNRRLSLVRQTYRGVLDRTLLDPAEHVDALLANMQFGRERLYDHLWAVMIDELFAILGGASTPEISV